MFTGAVVASATGTVDDRPVQTAASYDTSPDAFTTECRMAAPGSTAAWDAQVTVRTPGNEWQISLSSGQTIGDPSPGRHQLIGNSYPGQVPDGAVSLDVQSQQAVADYLSNGSSSYEYYMKPTTTYFATINPSLESGTLNVTLDADQAGATELTISGTWSCTS
ncbi:hypothetical protein KDK95_16630 [Actinospica sp. MGRD01-02]|uniref:Uncharacterized protein n=1 Tax=Actinospica acidithermotolerans TaxID=2828514 RepID=A0A941EHW1_9ACTN|nr:hypothetical protein [Actinospica acidithermotolerans]MBR7827944.1 hypothetical protein [Actinospica acidithermotolerans]